MIYLRVFLIFFIENCPKLRVCIPNFGQTLICYFRSKLRVRSVSSDNNICFKKYYTFLSKYKQFWQLNMDIWGSKIENSSKDLKMTSFFESLGESFI